MLTAYMQYLEIKVSCTGDPSTPIYQSQSNSCTKFGIFFLFDFSELGNING